MSRTLLSAIALSVVTVAALGVYFATRGTSNQDAAIRAAANARVAATHAAIAANPPPQIVADVAAAEKEIGLAVAEKYTTYIQGHDAWKGYSVGSVKCKIVAVVEDPDFDCSGYIRDPNGSPLAVFTVHVSYRNGNLSWSGARLGY